MLRFGSFGMKIGLYYVELHGGFDGKGVRVVRAQKIGFLSQKLDRHLGF